MKLDLFIIGLFMTSMYAMDSDSLMNKYSMEFSEPLFSIHQENLKVFLSGDEMKTKGDGIFEMFNVNTRLENDFRESNLSSEQAYYNEALKLIKFIRSVNLVFNTDKNGAQLRTDNLSVDLTKELITSSEFTTLHLNGSHISADSFSYDLKKDSEFLFHFYNGEFIDKSSLDTFGSAESIKLLENNTILLQGNASLNQGDLNISAESIYYDYQKKSVMKSLNAKITSG